jgi:hypothetical protein
VDVQVSHHPPVSALYATSESKKLQLLWWHQAVPRFCGNVISHALCISWLSLQAKLSGFACLSLNPVRSKLKMDKKFSARFEELIGLLFYQQATLLFWGHLCQPPMCTFISSGYYRSKDHE